MCKIHYKADSRLTLPAEWKQNGKITEKEFKVKTACL